MADRRGRDLLTDQAGAEYDEALAWPEHAAQADRVVERAQGVDVSVLLTAWKLPGAAAGGDHKMLVINLGARFEQQLALLNVEAGGAVAEQQLNALLFVPIG